MGIEVPSADVDTCARSLAITRAAGRLEDYRQAILHVGGEVAHRSTRRCAVDDALDGVDGLLLTGGDDVAPARYGEAPHPAVVEVDRRATSSRSR